MTAASTAASQPILICSHCKCEDQTMLDVYRRKVDSHLLIFCNQCGKSTRYDSDGKAHSPVPATGSGQS